MNEDKLTCFVIMPFGVKDDPARGDKIDFDENVFALIQGAVQDLVARGLPMECVRADKIAKAGLIHEQMIQQIAEAEVAVVDLTTANANVYYELGVRHTIRDRVTVLLKRKGTRPPFNLAGMKSIEYDLDPVRIERARAAIVEFVWNGLRSGDRDSLVYTVLPGLKPGLPSKALEDAVEYYALPGVAGKRIGIVSGDLRNVNLGDRLSREPIEVWVNSENLNMQMARPYEGSISGLVRYLGAVRDDTGAIVEDTVADALAAKMKGRQLVNPGEVVSTGAGALHRTHGVERLYHVAAAYGVVGKGYSSIANAELCVTNALARMDLEARGLVGAAAKAPKAGTKPVRRRAPPPKAPGSILFPVIGAGTARADVLSSARAQVGAAVAYLRSRQEITCVDRVCFLAPTAAVRAGLRAALSERKATPIADPAPKAARRR